MQVISIRSFALSCVASAAIFIAGCGDPVTQSNYDQIKAGMSKPEVEAILGVGMERPYAAGDSSRCPRDDLGGRKPIFHCILPE